MKQRGVKSSHRSLLWRLLRRVIPSTGELVYVSCGIAALLLVGLPEHLWMQLASGRWSIQNLSVPQNNLFTFSAGGHPWTNHQWASDVLVYWIFDRLGSRWWTLTQSLVYAWTITLLYWTLRRRGGVIPALALSLLSAIALSGVLEHTPLLLSLLFLTALLVLLETRGAGASRTLILIPPLFWLWANAHGSFLVGTTLLVAYALGNLRDSAVHRDARAWTVLVVVAGLSLLFSLWNPYYASLYQVGMEDLWQLLISAPLRLQVLPWWSAALALLLGLVAWLLIVAAGREMRWRLILPLLLLSPLAILNSQYLGFWAIWASITLMEHLQQVAYRLRHERSGYYEETGNIARVLRRLADWFSRASRLDRALPGGVAWIAATLIALAAFSVPPGVDGLVFGVTIRGANLEGQLSEQGVPWRASDALLANVVGESRVMAPARWGAFLEWTGFPIIELFMDARENAFPLEVVEDYDRFESALPGWEAVLDQYQVKYVVWDADAFQPRALEASGRWKRLYADHDAVLLVRKSSEDDGAVSDGAPESAIPAEQEMGPHGEAAATVRSADPESVEGPPARQEVPESAPQVLEPLAEGAPPTDPEATPAPSPPPAASPAPSLWTLPEMFRPNRALKPASQSPE